MMGRKCPIMNDLDVDTDDMSEPPVVTSLWPSTPFNDSWERTLTDPVNYVIIGSILWVSGLIISQLAPFDMYYSLPANRVALLSIPGAILAFAGYVLVGTGGSILLDLFTTEEVVGRTIHRGYLTVSWRPNPRLSLVSGVLSMGGLCVMLLGTLDMPVYTGELFWVVASVVSVALYIASCLFTVR